MSDPTTPPVDPDHEQPEIVPPGEDPVVPAPERPGPTPEPSPVGTEGAEVLMSDPNGNSVHGLAGGMGVSSERVGPAGRDGRLATHGTRPTEADPAPADPPPEQRPGAEEENPVGIPPKPATREFHGGQPGHSGAQGAAPPPS